MSRSMRQQLDSMERKALKCDLSRGEAARKNLSSDRCEHGDLVALALEIAHITRGQAAGMMGISEGLLSRQISNQDGQHLSWQRMFRGLPDEFWRALLVLIAERRGIATVTTLLTLTPTSKTEAA